MNPIILNNVSSWRLLVSEIFDIDPGVSAFFKKSVLKNNKWISLLFECDFHGNGPKAVSRACLQKGFSKGVAINIELYDDNSYFLRLDEESLEKVHNLYHVPSYAIFEKDRRFVIVSDSDYFWSIAGEKHFLETMFDMPAKEILKNFELGVAPYLNGTSDQTHVARNLLNYAKICESTLNEL